MAIVKMKAVTIAAQSVNLIRSLKSTFTAEIFILKMLCR